MVEHPAVNRVVAGSSPASGAKRNNMKRRSFLKFVGMLTVAPLSFLAPVAPSTKLLLHMNGDDDKWASNFTPPTKPRLLKVTWTRELQKDLEAIYG